MGKRYRKPPVIEALCEIRFEPSSPWDMAIPGLVYAEIRDTFPKRRQSRTLEVATDIGSANVHQQVLTVDRMQFLREDERALVQVGRNILAVNHLKPYPTWAEFLPLIRQALDAYLEVAKPKGIHRVGLRYVNHIEIPGERMGLEQYFEFRPFIGERLPQEVGWFNLGVMVHFEKARDALRLQLASAIAQKSNSVAVILDLDYLLAQPGAVSQENVLQWLEDAHDHVEEAFEACVTDRLRQMFEEVMEK